MAIEESLELRCREYAGTHERQGYKCMKYGVLGGSLDTFADFSVGKTPTVLLLRCFDTDREQFGEGATVRVSTRMKWGGPNWKWTEVDLDGSIPEPTLVSLIERSRGIVVGGLKEDEKLILSLIERKLRAWDVLAELIKSYGLTDRQAEIERLVKPAFIMRTTPVAEPELALGKSKIGGRPDLPKHLAWPTYTTGEPLAFLAQVNLAELPEGTELGGLPRNAILYAFSVYGWQSEGDADPRLPAGQYDNRWTQFLLGEDASALLERQDAKPGVVVYKAAQIEFVPILTLPTSTSEPAVSALDLTTEEAGQYQRIVWAFTDVCHYAIGQPARHLLLGYAEYVQSFVEEVGAGKMQLLMQIASDRNTGMCWGDGGNLYFWLTPGALARGNVRNVYTDYQCG